VPEDETPFPPVPPEPSFEEQLASIVDARITGWVQHDFVPYLNQQIIPSIVTQITSQLQTQLQQELERKHAELVEQAENVQSRAILEARERVAAATTQQRQNGHAVQLDPDVFDIASPMSAQPTRPVPAPPSTTDWSNISATIVNTATAVLPQIFDGWLKVQSIAIQKQSLAFQQQLALSNPVQLARAVAQQDPFMARFMAMHWAPDPLIQVVPGIAAHAVNTGVSAGASATVRGLQAAGLLRPDTIPIAPASPMPGGLAPPSPLAPGLPSGLPNMPGSPFVPPSATPPNAPSMPLPIQPSQPASTLTPAGASPATNANLHQTLWGRMAP